jgi:hypothetical protein
VQGHLRNEPVSIEVETECVHCSQRMTLHVDSKMKVAVDPAEANPLVFTPDVETWDTEAPSIVDDF